MADALVDSPRRRRRRWPYVLGGVLLLLIALVLLLPTLVSFGIGQGYIRDAIAQNINGTVIIDELDVGWFSAQNVKGFTIIDRAGQQSKLNVKVDRGLLSLLTNKTSQIEVAISGTLNGELREDGSVSFQDLVKSSPADAKKPNQSSQPSEPFRLPELPAAIVRIEGLDVSLAVRKTRETIDIHDLRGKLSYVAPNQPISVELRGKTRADHNGEKVSGSLDVVARADDVFDARGSLALRNASVKLDVDVKSVPLPYTFPGVISAGDSAQIQALSIDLASDDLTGKIVASFNVEGQIDGREPSGLQASLTVNKVLTTKGDLSLRGGSAHGNLQVRNVPLVTGNVQGIIPTMDATIASDDLTKLVELGIDGQTQVQGHQASPLTARLSVDQLLTPEGDVDFALDRVAGNFSGQTIPTALLQPLLNDNTPIIAARDIGPTVDVTASFSSGASNDVSIVARGEKAALEVTGNVNRESEGLTGSHLLLTASPADPVLVRAYTSLAVDLPTDLEIRLTSFSVPAKAQQRGLMKFAATGTLKVNGPTELLLAAAPDSPRAETTTGEGDGVALTVQDLNLQIDSPGLEQHLKLDGTAVVDGATVTIHQRITNLLNSDGRIAAMTAQPAGTLKLEGVSGATLVKFAPDQRELIDEVVGKSLNATVTTSIREEALAAEIIADADALALQLEVLRQPGALQLVGGQINVVVSPELAALVQKGNAEPIIPKQPTKATIDIQPIDFPRDANGNYALADQPAYATLTLASTVLENVPSIAEPLGVEGVVAQITREREGSYMTYAAVGDVSLRRPQADQLIGHARYNLKVQTKTLESGELEALPLLSVGFAELSIANLELALGQEAGSLSQWTGDVGILNMQASAANGSYKGDVRIDLPNVQGLFSGVSDGTMITLTSEPSLINLNRVAIERRMNAQDAVVDAPLPDEEATDDPSDERPSGPAPAASNIRVEADVPLTLSIAQLELPLAMVQGKPFNTKAVAVDLSLSGGPLRLANANNVRTSVSDLAMTVKSADIADGLKFTMTGNADASAPQASPLSVGEASTQPASQLPGGLNVTGTIGNLVGADGIFDMGKALAIAKLEMTAKATNMPTAVADAFVDMQGLLVAAVGPQMNATFVAEDFSSNTGDLDARIETTNGWLNAFVRGRQGALRTSKGKPIAAELAITPALRDRLLANLHPILADIRTTEQPLRISLPLAVVPTDGDISRLKADIEITIGKVQIDSGSRTLSVLKLFGEEEKRKTIPGEIEPISARIRNGIVKYEKFSVHIDKYTLNYFGEINLVKGTIDLHTELPLKALGQSIKELEGYADKIVVPLVMRGKIGEAKMKIDPDFDIGKAALEAGFRGGLNDLIKGEGGLLDDLLKDLGKKK